MPAAKKPADSGTTPDDAQAVDPPAEEAHADQAVAADPTVCVNCGKPATKRTTSAAYVPVSFCDACAAQAYPDVTGFEDVSAPAK